MLLLLLRGDVSLNPCPLTLGVLNAGCVRNKGLLLADMVSSNDLDFLSLTEIHICPFDSDTFIPSITPPDFIFLTGLVPQVFVLLVFSLDSATDPIKWISPLPIIWEYGGVDGCSLLLARIYRTSGSCTCNSLEEFMSFVGLLSSINSSYYICGDFNIHVDVPVSDGYKFMTFLDSCDLKQLVNQPTHLHGHILDVILSPSHQDTIVDFVILYLIMASCISQMHNCLPSSSGSHSK